MKPTARMQIVIEISEKDYKRIIKNDEDEQVQESCLCLLCRLSQAIKDGTPLPEGHGTLKDTDAICKDIISFLGIRDETYLLEAEKGVYKRIKNALTIIEADRAGSEGEE